MHRPARLVVIFETHATSLDNEAGLASGWFDVSLSALGEQQARELGARHGGDPIAAVFCSDLTRARRTAELAFGQRGLPIFPDARLREVDYGAMTRRSAAEIEAGRLERLTTPFPGGESYTEAVERVDRWLDETASNYSRQTVLVVGHRAIFYAFEHLLAGIPLRDAVASSWRWRPGWTYRLA